MKRGKAIIIVDVAVRDDWTMKDVMQNAPDWVESELGPTSVGRGGYGSLEKTPYMFSNATVYVSIEDFDKDRQQGVDHFTSKDQAKWDLGRKERGIGS